MADVGTDLIPLNQVREAVLSGYVPDVVNAEELALEFAERLMSATVPEDLFSIPVALKVGDVLGVPFVLMDAQFLKSEYDEGGFSVYALLRVVDRDGLHQAIACGGRNVVVQCLRAKEEGWLPWPIRIEEAGTQRQGRNRPLYMVTDERAKEQLNTEPKVKATK